MPGAEGTYPVYLDVFVAGQLIGAYQATEDVVIAAPALPQFYMPPTMDISIDHVEIVGYRYHRITFACLITNMGNASGAHTVEWHIFWNGNEFSHGHKSFTLGPGESYQWKKTVDVDFHRCHTCTAKLYGDWEENNFSEAYLIEGDVIIGNLIEEKHSEW